MTALTTKDSERFWFDVDRHGDNDCWPWMGHIAQHGYGLLSIQGKQQYTHRIAYTLAHGPITDGLHVDHLCMNKACVNPSHLEAVTLEENTRRYREAAGVGEYATHCSAGHEWTEENTYRTPDGSRRMCRSCIADRTEYSERGPSALRAGCPQGHPYDETNTYIDKHGHRYCISCTRERTRQWQDRQRGGPPRPYGAAITHCPQGHAYDDENTSHRPDGRRRCKACARDYAAQKRAERSAAA